MTTNTMRERILAQVEPILLDMWGYPVSALPAAGLEVVPAKQPDGPLAVRTDGGALLLADPQWQDAWQGLVRVLTLEQLFSILGVFELARTTLPDGVSVFGPVWYFLADRQALTPVPSAHVEELDGQPLRDLDPAVYWHCSTDTASRGFAVREAGHVTALATVWQNPDTLWEIGVDVLPAAQGRGQGRAVVSAAAEWILSHAPLVVYTTGAFNIPSTRTAHSLGLRHIWTTIKRVPPPFVVPPGPIGSPRPDIVPQAYWKDYPE